MGKIQHSLAISQIINQSTENDSMLPAIWISVQLSFDQVISVVPDISPETALINICYNGKNCIIMYIFLNIQEVILIYQHLYISAHKLGNKSNKIARFRTSIKDFM